MVTNYGNLFQQIDRLIEEVEALKRLVFKRIEKPEEIPKKHLNLSDALKFLKNQGFVMSDSKMYKLCAKKQIPHNHFGNKLVFNTKELIGWAENQIKK